MYRYPCASGYTDERIADAGPPHTRAHVLRPSVYRLCARALVCVCDRGPRIRADTCERPSVGVDCGWLGAQAFQHTSAFNANIGAWNTASVSNLKAVCAALSGLASAPPRRHALNGSTMRHGPLCVVCGGGADARAHVCVRRRVGTRMRGRPRA
jgi:hypothetical protein